MTSRFAVLTSKNTASLAIQPPLTDMAGTRKEVLKLLHLLADWEMPEEIVEDGLLLKILTS